MLLAVSRPTLAGCVALLALSGCSLGRDEEAKPIRGAPREVVATVGRLERATRQRDWRTICDVLFTRSARRRAGGSDCRRRLAADAQDARRPRIQLLSIKVSSDRASVRVRSRAVGQAPLVDVIEMRRVGHAYRIEALD
jgi:superfamily II DNA or RNA helicase